MALSIEAPRPRPRERIISTSLVKPKVRARAMSLLVLAGAEVELDALAGLVDGWVIEVDLEGQLVAVVRLQPGPLEVAAFALAHLDGLGHAHELLGRFLQLDAGALQQVHERGRRAVEDGHFFGGDVDVDVVQAQTCASRHQVLDGVDLGRARVATGRDGGGHAAVAHRLGLDGDVHRLAEVDPTEDDAGVGRCRAQRQFDALAAVQAHADGAGQGLEGALLQHGGIIDAVQQSVAPRGFMRAIAFFYLKCPGQAEARLGAGGTDGGCVQRARRRRALAPTKARPIRAMAQVSGSGTANTWSYVATKASTRKKTRLPRVGGRERQRPGCVPFFEREVSERARGGAVSDGVVLHHGAPGTSPRRLRSSRC